MRGKTKKVFCKHCGAPFFARVADLNRGWGVFCSKSCKAKYQFKMTTESFESVKTAIPERTYELKGSDLLNAKFRDFVKKKNKVIEELLTKEHELEMATPYKDFVFEPPTFDTINEKVLEKELAKVLEKELEKQRKWKQQKQKQQQKEAELALKKMCEEAEALIS